MGCRECLSTVLTEITGFPVNDLNWHFSCDLVITSSDLNASFQSTSWNWFNFLRQMMIITLTLRSCPVSFTPSSIYQPSFLTFFSHKLTISVFFQWQRSVCILLESRKCLLDLNGVLRCWSEVKSLQPTVVCYSRVSKSGVFTETLFRYSKCVYKSNSYSSCATQHMLEKSELSSYFRSALCETETLWAVRLCESRKPF